MKGKPFTPCLTTAVGLNSVSLLGLVSGTGESRGLEHSGVTDVVTVVGGSLGDGGSNSASSNVLLEGAHRNSLSGLVDVLGRLGEKLDLSIAVDGHTDSLVVSQTRVLVRVDTTSRQRVTRELDATGLSALLKEAVVLTGQSPQKIVRNGGRHD